MENKLLKYSYKEEKTGCRIWMKQVKDNFPQVRTVGNERLKAHFVAYELWVGVIPEDMIVVQSCGNRICIEPTHLELKRDPKSFSIEDRLLLHSVEDPETGCRIWIGTKDQKGYGHFRVGGRKGYVTKAHRAVYEHKYGKLPTEVFVRHMCHNPACINIEHLLPGSHQDNMDDMVNAGRQSKLKGEQHGGATITDETVRAIKRLHNEGFSYSQIAGICKTSRSNVAGIVRGERWSHVT